MCGVLSTISSKLIPAAKKAGVLGVATSTPAMKAIAKTPIPGGYLVKKVTAEATPAAATSSGGAAKQAAALAAPDPIKRRNKGTGASYTYKNAPDRARLRNRGSLSLMGGGSQSLGAGVSSNGMNTNIL